MKREFKGIWIPKEIWLARDLSLIEKVFLVEIDSLDNDERGCFASNAYFAEFFGISTRQVSSIINELVRKNLISSEVMETSGNARQLHILWFAKVQGVAQEVREGYGRKLPEGMEENFHHNNTDNNPKNKNKKNGHETATVPLPKDIAMPSFPVPRLDADPLLWAEWVEMRRKRKKPLTQRGYDNLVRGLRQLIDFNINERLELAIDRKWLGLVFENDKTGDTNGQYKSTADKRADTAFNTERVIQQLQSQILGGDTPDHRRLT